MPLRTIVRAPSLQPDTRTWFRDSARLVFRIYADLRRRNEIPASSIVAVLADDFAAEVEHHQPFGGRFDTARVGGSITVGKNLDQASDASAVVIVLDASFWRDDDPASRMRALVILAHELAHPMLSRASHAAGAMDGVELPSVTPREGARSGARIMADEYRADRLAEMVAGELGSIEVAGITRPHRTWITSESDYGDALATALAAAHPGWPDTVDRYRDHQITIEEMWGAIVQAVDQTLTLLFHAQALADAADSGVEILALPELRDLPAVRLYLAGSLAPFIELVRVTPPLVHLRETRKVVERFAEVGATAHFEIWRRLGIRPRDLPRPSVYLDVDEPLR